MTILLGIAGALVGGFLGRAVGWYGPNDAAGFLMALVGAGPESEGRRSGQAGRVLRGSAPMARAPGVVGEPTEAMACPPAGRGAGARAQA